MAGIRLRDLLFGIVGAAIIWIAHHDNIARLLRGEERRFDPIARGGENRSSTFGQLVASGLSAAGEGRG